MGFNIKNIAVHHYGATNKASSMAYLQETDINAMHKQRWSDFPSELSKSYIGYNIIIFQDSWKQFRYIGEETAANKGFNFDTVSICLAGNFSKESPDKPNYYQTTILKKICEALLDGHPERMDLKVKEGTKINISLSRILPHRRFSTTPTECYGDSMNDLWVQKLLASKQPTREQLLLQLRDLLQVYFKLLAKKQLRGVGSSCVSSNERG